MKKNQLIILLLFITHVTSAETPPAAPDLPPLVSEPLYETVVVTGTRRETALAEQSTNTAVVGQPALRLVGHTHINEVFTRVAGANIERGNGQEYLASIRSPILTGAGACGAFLTAQDGVPLRAAGFCNANELFEANTEQAQRIEVVRGPGTALYGSNALHGIVNVISPDAFRKATSGVGLEAGPNDYARVKFTTGNALAPMAAGARQAYRLNVNATHDGGYRDDSGFDQQKMLLSHFYEADVLSVDSTLSATNLNQETAGYIEGVNAYKSDAARRSNPNPEAYRDAQSLRLASRLTYQVNDTREVKITPYARDTDMVFLQHFLPGLPLEENSQKSLGVQSAFYQRLGDKGQWIWGADVEYTRAFLRETQNSPTAGSAFLRETIPVGKHYDYEVDAVLFAPFMHVEWPLNPVLTLTAGVRFETLRYDYDNRMLAGRTREDGSACGFGGCRFSRPPDRTDQFENWSPKVGLNYEVAPSHRFYLQLSRGFRAPQATELYRLQREQQVADLESEHLDSVEFGLRGWSGEHFNYEVARYAMAKENVIFRDSDFFNVSDGKTRHRGIEVDLHYNLSPNWRFSANATYARHTYARGSVEGDIDIEENDVDSAPRRFGSARVHWRAGETAEVELEWLYMGAYFTDAENLHRYGGHNLFNLRAQWRLNGSTRIFGRVANLTNREYAERADFTAFSGDRYFPGEPRALFAGVEWLY